jgi:hypothetical protein
MKVETIKVYDKVELTCEEQKFLGELVELAGNLVRYKADHGYMRESVEGFLGEFVVMLSECGECDMSEYY